MSDLVERLREGAKSPAKFDDTGWTAATCGIVSEAADRIEQLERVLAQARECLTSTAYFSEEMAPDVIKAIDEALK